MRSHPKEIAGFDPRSKTPFNSGSARKRSGPISTSGGQSIYLLELRSRITSSEECQFVTKFIGGTSFVVQRSFNSDGCISEKRREVTKEHAN